MQTDKTQRTLKKIENRLKKATALWFLCGGFLSALGWWIAGLLWCITVVGIPIGVQCFKLSSISLNPFGKEIVVMSVWSEGS